MEADGWDGEREAEEGAQLDSVTLKEGHTGS